MRVSCVERVFSGVERVLSGEECALSFELCVRQVEPSVLSLLRPFEPLVRPVEPCVRVHVRLVLFAQCAFFLMPFVLWPVSEPVSVQDGGPVSLGVFSTVQLPSFSLLPVSSLTVELSSVGEPSVV